MGGGAVGGVVDLSSIVGATGCGGGGGSAAAADPFAIDASEGGGLRFRD